MPLEVKLSNEPLVVVQIEERLYGFKNRHAVKSGVKRFPSPSLSTFEHPQAAQLVVTKHAQSFRCDSSHSFVAGRKVSHFEECTISLYLNPKEKTLVKRIITQNSPTVATVCRNLHTVDKCSVTPTLISAHLSPETINGSKRNQR